jgi:ribose 5-phosphate isomerase A
LLLKSATGIDELASAAVAEIRTGMRVGLGTGRAATRGIEALARRAVTEHLELVCVATSHASEELGRRLGLTVTAMEGIESIDYLFDGADEVDPLLRMIKGRGGAMTREKIVAHSAARRVYLVQRAKLAQRLGEKAPLPVEVLRFGMASTVRALRKLGLQGPVRQKAGGGDYETDNGNPIIDAPLPVGLDPGHLAAALDATPGVIGHGFFLNEADVVLAEDEEGRVSRQDRPAAASTR